MESAPVYAAPGRLLFTREGVLAARPFDLQTLKLAGEAVSLDDAPTTVIDPALSDTAGRLVSASSDGTLAYFSSPPVDTVATWLDLTGTAVGTLPLPPASYLNVAVAPDGTRAVLVRAVSPSESSLWLTDLSRGGAVALSTGPGLNTSPVWSPDSRRVVFASDRDGPQNFYLKTIGDPSSETLLYRSSVLFENPIGWSPDAKWILFTETRSSSPGDVYMLPASAGGTPQSYVEGPRTDAGGVLSPDGDWAAYQSDDTGRAELYVQSFPTPGRTVQVSIEGAGGIGGGAPVPYWWTPDSRQLLFVGIDLRSLWRADLVPGPVMKVGRVTRIATLPPGIVSIDMTPDRRRFLALLPKQAGVPSITIVQHWQAGLAKGR
jgi:eukaryotic-like serine/threonine-protein kinase